MLRIPFDPFEIISTFFQIQEHWMVEERDLFNEKLNGLLTELEEIEEGRRELMKAAAEASAETGPQDLPAPPDDKEKVLQQVRITAQAARKRYASVSRWLRRLVEDMPPSTKLAKSRAVFWVDQVIHALAPANCFWTNPRAVQLFLESGGETMKRGVFHLLEDFRSGELLPSLADKTAFEPGVNIATTPGSVVFRNDLVELLQYDPPAGKVFATPVLLIPPWINKYYILDLNEQASLVRYLTGRGFNVFMISWKNPGEGMRNTDFADYLFDGIMKSVQVAREISRARQVHAAGYCIGGTALACLMAWAAGQKGQSPFADWTLFAGLTDFSDPGEIGVFISERSFRFLEFMAQRDGFLDSKYINAAFRLLRPNALLWPSYVQNYLCGGSPPRSDVFFWNGDGTRLPQAMCSFYLKEFYLENNLARGNLSVSGKPLDLMSIREPLYVVASEQDHISPWKSVYKISGLVKCPVRLALPNEGHITGVVNPPSEYSRRVFRLNDVSPGLTPEQWLEVSPECQGSWWPDWVSWLTQRSGTQKKARPAGSAKYPQLDPAPGRYVLEK